ncbi:hypothetical protein J3F83DRAFT_496664 [Trichoderma novae-zelandiae]
MERQPDGGDASLSVYPCCWLYLGISVLAVTHTLPGIHSIITQIAYTSRIPRGGGCLLRSTSTTTVHTFLFHRLAFTRLRRWWYRLATSATTPRRRSTLSISLPLLSLPITLHIGLECLPLGTQLCSRIH